MKILKSKFVDDIYANNEDERRLFCNTQKPDCFSRLMTPDIAIEWWKQEKSLQGFDTMNLPFRRSIIKFLLFDKNQSNVERVFGSLQKKASPHRPRLDHETILYEEITQTFKHQPEIFQHFRNGDKEDSKDKDSKGPKKLRNELKMS